MATLEKALDKMREICLSLPDTREGDHFGETAFYVRGKLFATCGAKHGVCEITFGLEPDHAAALLENDPRFKPYSRDKRGVVLDAAKVKSWGEVKELILESYELVMPPKVKKAPPKESPRRQAHPPVKTKGLPADAGRSSIPASPEERAATRASRPKRAPGVRSTAFPRA